jgi:hypothetical protein
MQEFKWINASKITEHTKHKIRRLVDSSLAS